MSNFLRQATASQVRTLGPFLDDTDFKTAETGLTIANTDIKLVVNGGASANKNSGGGTHRINGMYGVTFDATDTAIVGEIEVSVQVAGALPTFKTFYVLEEVVFDALFVASATGMLPANVTQWLGSAAATPTVAGVPEVDLTHVGGSAATVTGGRPEVNVSHWGGTAIASAVVLAAANIAADALTAAKIAADVGTEIATAVWASATRLLTAGTNIALAKGTGVTGFNDLDAAGIRTATGLASANLDTQLSAIAAFIDTEVGTILARMVGISILTGTVVTGSNTPSSIKTDLAQTADSYHKRSYLLITSGALIHQQARILAYDGTNKIITLVEGLTGTPADGVTFAIINR